MKKTIAVFLLILICLSVYAAAVSEAEDRIKIKVLILPKFEEGEMEDSATDLASDEGVETADIFATAMENNFLVGEIIINAILDGRL